MHPSTPTCDSGQVSFIFDGEAISGLAGANLVVTLMAAGQFQLRTSPRLGGPRGAFCFMGSCQECVVWVNGERRPACQVLLREGMNIRSGAIAEGVA